MNREKDDNPLKDLHPMSISCILAHAPPSLSEAAQSLAGSRILRWHLIIPAFGLQSIYVILCLHPQFISIWWISSVQGLWMCLAPIRRWRVKSVDSGADAAVSYLNRYLPTRILILRDMQNLGRNGCPYHITLHGWFSHRSFHLCSWQCQFLRIL